MAKFGNIEVFAMEDIGGIWLVVWLAFSSVTWVGASALAHEPLFDVTIGHVVIAVVVGLIFTAPVFVIVESVRTVASLIGRWRRPSPPKS